MNAKTENCLVNQPFTNTSKLEPLSNFTLLISCGEILNEYHKSSEGTLKTETIEI